MSDGYLIARDPKIILREEFDQWGILFNPDTSEVVSINAMGIYIWKSISGSRRFKDIMETIYEKYDQVPKEAQEQVSAFIEQLIKRGFVNNLSKEEKE